MTPPDTAHALIVPFAVTDDAACRQRLGRATLPHLLRLLQSWHPGPLRPTGANSLNAPHELALAHALGWNERRDGTLPLAAWCAGITDSPCAWLHPCHWNVGLGQVSLQSADGMGLGDAESRALFAALQPLAQEDGLHLVYEQPQRWRAEGEVFRDLPWASLDRVANRTLHGWLPDATANPAVRPLLRLQNEAQMLFYTHPVHDERAAQGLAPVNGVWISGAGVLYAHERRADAPTLVDTLRHPALQGDWGAWASAWEALDAGLVASWLERAARGEALTLTLCSERGWQTWASPSTAATAAASAAASRGRRAWWQRWSLGWLKGPAGPTTQSDVAGILLDL